MKNIILLIITSFVLTGCDKAFEEIQKDYVVQPPIHKKKKEKVRNTQYETQERELPFKTQNNENVNDIK